MYDWLFKVEDSNRLANVVAENGGWDNIGNVVHLEPRVSKQKVFTSSDIASIVSLQSEGKTVHDLQNYFHSAGVVGEESNCILQTLCVIEGISFGIEGPSGSGKSLLLDSLVDLLPEGEVYKSGSSSDLALFYDYKEINKSKYLYISEIQKSLGSKSSPVVELIKDLSEGKSSTRRVTLPNRQVAKYKIKKGVSVMYTLADENTFKKDEELSRRVVRLRTDTSGEHIEDILRAETLGRMGSTTESSRASCSSDYSDLGAYISSCSDLDVKIIDPFAEYIRGCFNEEMTPSDLKKYNSLLDACVKFNHPRRQQVRGGLLANLEDHVLVYSIFCTSTVEGRDKVNRDGDDSIVHFQKAVDSGMKAMKKKLKPASLAKWVRHQLTFRSREPWVMDYLESFMSVHYGKI